MFFRCGLFVCLSDYSESCERILTKFFGGVWAWLKDQVIRITLMIQQSKIRNPDHPDRWRFFALYILLIHLRTLYYFLYYELGPLFQHLVRAQMHDGGIDERRR